MGTKSGGNACSEIRKISALDCWKIIRYFNGLTFALPFRLLRECRETSAKFRRENINGESNTMKKISISEKDLQKIWELGALQQPERNDIDLNEVFYCYIQQRMLLQKPTFSGCRWLAQNTGMQGILTRRFFWGLNLQWNQRASGQFLLGQNPWCLPFADIKPK